MSPRYDVAVIGGGLVGAALAFGLRALGSKLAVLDEGDVAHRAARGNFGLIWVQGKGAGYAPYASWTQRSAREWPAFASTLLAETGIDVALEQPGGLSVCLSRIEPRAGRFALSTPHGTFEAERVVVAAGLGTAALAPMVGIAAPVRPNKGQIIVLERLPRFLDFPIETIRQTDEGTVLIGDSQQERGFDETLDVPVLAAMAERATRAFPHLRDARVVRSWAALRVMTPDGFPIYERSPAHAGAFVAACHSGVTLAAAHARVLGPALLEGSVPDACAPFTTRRFDVPQAA